MDKSLALWIIMGFIVAALGAAAIDYLAPQIHETDENSSFVACGCGCCRGTDPIIQCIYHSRNDSIEKLMRQDMEILGSPQCPYVGCTRGIEYTYCD